MNRRFSAILSPYYALPEFEKANPGMGERIDAWAEEKAGVNRARQALETTYQSDDTKQLEVEIEIRAEWTQVRTALFTITTQRIILIVYQGPFALVYEKERTLFSSY